MSVGHLVQHFLGNTHKRPGFVSYIILAKYHFFPATVCVKLDTSQAIIYSNPHIYRHLHGIYMTYTCIMITYFREPSNVTIRQIH